MANEPVRLSPFSAPPAAPVQGRRAVPGVSAPGLADRLNRVLPRGGRQTIHWVGVHGGAGEDTLAAAIPGSVAAGHGWPTMPAAGSTSPSEVPVVLVARTHKSGLMAAQSALREWAAGDVAPVRMLGLVLIADAAGRQPKPLRDLQRIVSGGAENVWTIPFIETLRLRSKDDVPPTDSSFEALRRAIAKQF